MALQSNKEKFYQCTVFTLNKLLNVITSRHLLIKIFVDHATWYYIITTCHKLSVFVDGQAAVVQHNLVPELDSFSVRGSILSKSIARYHGYSF